VNRKWRKRIGIDRWKGIGVRFLFYMLSLRGALPRPLLRVVLFLGALGFRLAWFVPFNPWREALNNLVHLGARGGSGFRIYSRLLSGASRIALVYLDAHRYGLERILPRIRTTPKANEIFEAVAAEGGKAIVVLPHVPGGVLSAAHVSRKYPLLVLYRSPRDQTRADMQKEFIRPLDLKLLEIHRTNPVVAARQLLGALKGSHIVVGLTDVIYKRDDTIEAVFFGQRVPLPDWPARFARQAKAPILPGYVSIDHGEIVIDLDDPIRERDLVKATQAWAAALERFILREPWEWAFGLDRRWGKVLKQAARERVSE